jgi:hypothetical protein
VKLVDLDPRWLAKDGQRVGIVFRSPTNSDWYQSCLFEKTAMRAQWALFDAAFPEREHGAELVQACERECAWTATGDTFDTLTITPSIDGSRGGLWHGFITNGAIA